jgi:hypothetical protein
MGRTHKLIAVETEVAKALVVADDQQDVGFGYGLCARIGTRERNQWR